MENRFVTYTNRVAQNVLGNLDLTHEEAFVESVAPQSKLEGPHFSAKTGTSTFTIYVELLSRPGITVRVVGKASVARAMAKVKAGDKVKISGKFNESDATLNAFGKLRRQPVVFLEGDLAKEVLAFQIIVPAAAPIEGAEQVS